MTDKNSSYGYRELLSRENQSLAEENRKLRQCLQLTKENCDLHTLNYIMHALSMNDAKLRKFYTDVILPSTQRSLSTPPRAPNTTDKHPSRHTNIDDTSYGKSFPEMHLDEIQSSYNGQYTSRSNSYGQSFKEIDLNELRDSHESNTSSYAPGLKDGHVDKSYVQHVLRDNRTNSTQGQSPICMHCSDRQVHSFKFHSAPNTPVTDRYNKGSISPHQNRTPTFYDSLEANRTDHSNHQPTQRSHYQSSIRDTFYSDPRETQQMQMFQDTENAPSHRNNEVNGSQRSSTRHSLHMSDLGNTEHPSAFIPYKRDTMESTQNQVDFTQHQRYSVNSSPHSVGHDSVVSAPVSPAEMKNGQPSPRDGETQMLVRVNTTVGRVGGNGQLEKSQFTEEYSVPYKDATPLPRDSATGAKEEGTLERFNERAGQKGHSASVSSHTSRHQKNTRNLTHDLASSRRSLTSSTLNTSNQKHQPHDVVRYMPTGDDSGLPSDNENSVFMHDSGLYNKQRGLHQPPLQGTTPQERPKSVTFDLDRQEPEQSSQVGCGYPQDSGTRENTINGSIYTGNDSRQESDLLGEPIATSTPRRSPGGKTKLFSEERQSNSDQLDQYISDFTGSYNTAPTSIQPSALLTSTERSPRSSRQQTDPSVSGIRDDTRIGDIRTHRSVNTLGTGITQVRCSSAPPPRYEIPNKSDSPVGKAMVASEPDRRKRRKSKNSSSGEKQILVLLADILRIRGNNAVEIVEAYLFRPVDVLTGYVPEVTSEMCRLLMEVTPSRRMVGEIAFQLDRRILEFVIRGFQDEFQGKKQSFRYYGYSLTNIKHLIAKETAAGLMNPDTLWNRFEWIKKKLKPFDYQFDVHAEFTQDMVNKYGLLNISSSSGEADKYGLSDTCLTRLRLCQILDSNGERENMLIIYDCLCFLSFDDGKPLFLC